MAKNQASVKVLVVEDDPFLVRVYESKLSKEGFTVILAMNGDEALEKAEKDKPDIILLDLIMPIKNGFDTLVDLKADASLKSIPVIIMSNLGQDSDIEKGMDLGAKDYFVKAKFSIGDIPKLIRKHL